MSSLSSASGDVPSPLISSADGMSGAAPLPSDFVTPSQPLADESTSQKATLPDCNFLTEKTRGHHKYCCDNGHTLISQAIEHLASILEKIELSIAAHVTPAMDTIGHCCGNIIGQCQCCCDDACKCVDKLQTKIYNQFQSVLMEGFQYAARAGIYPRFPQEAIAGVQPQVQPHEPVYNPPQVSNQPTPVIPGRETSGNGNALPPVAIGVGQGGAGGAGGVGIGIAAANAESQAAALAAAIAGASATATQAITINAQSYPLTLYIQLLTQQQLELLIQAIQQIVFQVSPTTYVQVEDPTSPDGFKKQPKIPTDPEPIREAGFLLPGMKQYKTGVVGSEEL